MPHTSTLDFRIHLDEQNIPETIDWDATQSPVSGRKDCKAMLVSLWDGEAKQALRIDLWTKEMEVGEMNHFFFQTLMTLADTYGRATNNPTGRAAMRQFAQEFARKNKLSNG